MVIDFHTHAFPQAIAARAMTSLLEEGKEIYTPVHDGTLAGLLKNMDDWNIDISIVQPVLTKPSQMQKINERARIICSERIISFGAIDPHADDYKSQIDFVVSLGLKGLKFHAEYQNFSIDDKRMLKIYDYALSKGLIIFHHAGFDPAYPAPYKSSPKQFAAISDAMQGGVIVAAHLGGQSQWDEVEKYLTGKNIYLDTSMGFEFFPHDQFLRIVKAHGADKILFGSDSPWSNAKTEIEHLQALPLTAGEKEGIFYKNAQRILNL
jgi:predicted TIM-barrel fold metal-dependent hydrolase